MQHRNARLTPNGRLQMIRLVEERGLNVRGGRGRLERVEVDRLGVGRPLASGDA